MNPKNLRKGVKLSNRLYETEASGGINLKNVRKIAATGVAKEFLVGQITHSAPAVRFSTNFFSFINKSVLYCYSLDSVSPNYFFFFR